MTVSQCPSLTPVTLLELIERSPSEKTAIILPEHQIRVSYGELDGQVRAVAEQLAAAGVGRGDRVGIALPNGLAMIVAFLAASSAGTAGPLNPAYTEDEFRFYLEDTGARVLILPHDGAEAARHAPRDPAPGLHIEKGPARAVPLATASGGLGHQSFAPPAVD